MLQPFYEKDIADGVTTDEEVEELLELYRIKITSIECFASSGVTGGVLSGNTFNNLSMGGLGYDADGSDASGIPDCGSRHMCEDLPAHTLCAV